VPAPRPERFSAPSSYGVGGGGEEPGASLPWAEVERWLVGSRSYWLATVRDDGRPHAMPVWGVWLDGAVWFSTHPGSVKGRNLDRDPRAVVHLESGDEVAILEGVAARPDSFALDRFVDAYEDKYGHRIEPGERAMGIYRLPPGTVLAWREADYPRSATRWVFERR
jgi:PPOX class probable F420-dependent enzyme